MKLSHYLYLTIGVAVISIIFGCGPVLWADYVLTKNWFSAPSIVIIVAALLLGGLLFKRIMRGVPSPEFKMPWHNRAKHEAQAA